MGDHIHEISEEEWLELFKKRAYYANEMAIVIFNLPPEQARAAKDKFLSFLDDSQELEDLRTKFIEISELSHFQRLQLLLRKFAETICCARCAVTSILAAFISVKCDTESPNSTLH